ncbi:MAG: two-component sensor histidine kinase [Bacteroidetes bacterium]|nr:two-component sensor histidine kinase [Bacteroidota bacterium]
MYSLRFQLLLSALIAAVGGATAFYFHPSFLLSLVILLGSVLLSYGILYFFVYRPLLRIQRVVDAQEDKLSVLRFIASSSDEFQRLSTSFNTMLESFRADIIRMKKLEGVRSEFLGNVSHELRTPLFSTQGLIETLLHGAVDDKKVNRDFLAKALNNIERLNSLLEELIDISRIESGEMKLRLRYFDIVPMLRAAVADMQTYAGQREIVLTFVGPADTPLEVFGDKERLRQVAVNLMENAIKYSEKGGTVVLSVSDAGDRAEIAVKDTGIGIAPQHLPRIFERFYRVDKDRSRDVGGSGLGLAIVKHIVEAHGSTISVKSTVGIGTTFAFTVSRTGVE